MKLKDRMNRLLDHLGIPLRVSWLPRGNAEEHARISLEEGLIIIYDKDEEEALHSLFHEILEFRLRNLLSPYRAFVNKLIEFIGSQIYTKF